MTEAPEVAVKIPATFAEAQDVLAANLPGYTRREHQIAMAEQIELIVSSGKHGLVQGGTGIGKSLAGLIPLILAGGRTVVATATKALQVQYASKDLPFLEENLPVDFTWAVLMGRANYPCHARIEEMKNPTRAQAEVIARVEEISTPEAVRELKVITREDFPEMNKGEWQPFSMSADECPGADHCPFGTVCLAARAKQKAATASVIITNTAYLLQDLKLRLQSGNRVTLLGDDIDHILVDEGHTLPDVATSALEDTIGEGSIVKLSRDMAAYMNQHDLEVSLAEAVEHAAGVLWNEVTVRYLNWVKVKALGKYDPMPLPFAVLANDFGEQLPALIEAIREAREEIMSQRVDDEGEKLHRTRLLNRSVRMMDRLYAYAGDDDDKTVRWAVMEVNEFRGERRERLFLNSAPVSVGPFLRSAMWEKTPTILLSATLTAGKNDFSYMARTVGLDLDGKNEDGEPEAFTYSAGTPFDYQRQAMLFTPGADKPFPSGKTEPAWRAYAQAAMKYLVTESQGGALLLFTSRRNMEDAYQRLAGDFRAQGLHVMKQDDATPAALVRMMKEDKRSVLFGLRTFFEGIDVQGDALRLVVMDKLPFAVPTDLVHKAREEAIIRAFNSRWAGFDKMTVPQMVLILTQGFGRLIRHRDDKGVVAILDPRLSDTTKKYAKDIMRELPPARRTNDPEAAAFLRQCR